MPRRADRLSTRALNRALLQRQSLLRRRRAPMLETVERLVALQAQVPRDPYVALWSRLDRFDAADLSTAVEDRHAVRMTLLRGTLHLVTARDAFALRPAIQPLIDRTTARVVRQVADDVGRDELVRVFRELLEEEPRTRAQLADAIRDRFPGRDVATMTLAMYLLPTVQVTPRGLWRRSGASAFTTLDRWLGAREEPASSVDDLVLRYLAVHGPATPADAQTWSGLAGMREVLERLRPKLRVVPGEDGRELFDIPDGPLPDPETSAPVRFLPEYDNALIGFADRTRVIPPSVPQWTAVGWAPVLVGGWVAARWRLSEERDAATLRVETFGRLPRDARADVLVEADRLARFLLDGRDDTDVRITAYDP